MKRQFKKIAVAAGLLVNALSPFSSIKVNAAELYPLNQRHDFIVTRIDHRKQEISFVYENTSRIPVFANVFYGDATDEQIAEAHDYIPNFSLEIVNYRDGGSTWQGFESNKEYTIPSTNVMGWNDLGNLYYIMGYKEDENSEVEVEIGRAKYDRCLNAELYRSSSTAFCRVEIWDDGKIHYQPYEGWNRLVVGDEEENAGSITKENIKTVTVFMPDIQYVDREVEVPVEVPVEVEKIVEVPVEVEKIVEVPVEVPVEVEKIVEVPVEVEKIVEVPVEVPVEVEKIVEVPIYQTEIKTVDRLIEVPIEKEVVKEIEKKVEIPVEKEVVKEVAKEVPVEVKTVEKVAVNVPVEKPITNTREITKEVPVTTEKVNTVEVVKEVPVYQTKVEQVDSDIDVPSLGGCNEEGEWINRILAFITGVILASVGWIAVIMLKKRSENNNN